MARDHNLQLSLFQIPKPRLRLTLFYVWTPSLSHAVHLVAPGITVPRQVFSQPVIAAGGVVGMGMAADVVASGIEVELDVGGVIDLRGFEDALRYGEFRHDSLFRALPKDEPELGFPGEGPAYVQGGGHIPGEACDHGDGLDEFVALGIRGDEHVGEIFRRPIGCQQEGVDFRFVAGDQREVRGNDALRRGERIVEEKPLHGFEPGFEFAGDEASEFREGLGVSPEESAQGGEAGGIEDLIRVFDFREGGERDGEEVFGWHPAFADPPDLHPQARVGGGGFQEKVRNGIRRVQASQMGVEGFHVGRNRGRQEMGNDPVACQRGDGGMDFLPWFARRAGMTVEKGRQTFCRNDPGGERPLLDGLPERSGGFSIFPNQPTKRNGDIGIEGEKVAWPWVLAQVAGIVSDAREGVPYQLGIERRAIVGFPVAPGMLR